MLVRYAAKTLHLRSRDLAGAVSRGGVEMVALGCPYRSAARDHGDPAGWPHRAAFGGLGLAAREPDGHRLAARRLPPVSRSAARSADASGGGRFQAVVVGGPARDHVCL